MYDICKYIHTYNAYILYKMMCKYRSIVELGMSIARA